MNKTILILGLLTSLVSQAQDVHFSQQLMNPLVINPANTGAFKGDLRGSITYRDQWRSVATPYKTYAVGLDSKILKKKITSGFLAAGLQIYSDKAGEVAFGTTNLSTSLAYGLELSDNQTLTAGIQGSVKQRSITPGDARWDDQYDGSGYNAGIGGEAINANSFIKMDAAVGIRWDLVSQSSNLSSKNGFKATVGYSLFHVNTPSLEYTINPESLYTRSVIHADFKIGINNSDLWLEPTALVFLKGPDKEILFGTYARYQLKEESKYTSAVKGASFAVGMHYRLKDAYIASVMVDHGNFAFGVSYDINVSGLKEVSNGRGGMEITLRFTNPNPFTAGSSARFL